MFGRKSSSARAAAKAEKKAVKAAAKAAKKADKKAAKLADKADAKVSRASAKADAKAAKAAAKAAPRSLFDKVTDPKAAKRALTVAKVVGPAIAPFALKAATSTRDYLDTRKASRLGVSPDEVGAYRGPTGPAQARLTGLTASIAELRARRSGDLQVTRFADVAARRLADLRTAVTAAASMPAGRRRSTLNAVDRELNQIDADLMTFLVGS